MSGEHSGNGRAPLTKEALADRSRFQFKTENLDLSEHITGVVLVLKTLSVQEREDLPDLTDKEGKPDVDFDKLAAIFAAAVSEPKVTADEAKAFLGDWPAPALDLVIEKFGELAGGKDEESAAAGTFSAGE